MEWLPLGFGDGVGILCVLWGPTPDWLIFWRDEVVSQALEKEQTDNAYPSSALISKNKKIATPQDA